MNNQPRPSGYHYCEIRMLVGTVLQKIKGTNDETREEFRNRAFDILKRWIKEGHPTAYMSLIEDRLCDNLKEEHYG